MKTKVGILYSSVDSQTLKICNVIKEVLEEKRQHSTSFLD